MVGAPRVHRMLAMVPETARIGWRAAQPRTDEIPLHGAIGMHRTEISTFEHVIAAGAADPWARAGILAAARNGVHHRPTVCARAVRRGGVPTKRQSCLCLPWAPFCGHWSPRQSQEMRAVCASATRASRGADRSRRRALRRTKGPKVRGR